MRTETNCSSLYVFAIFVSQFRGPHYPSPPGLKMRRARVKIRLSTSEIGDDL